MRCLRFGGIPLVSWKSSLYLAQHILIHLPCFPGSMSTMCGTVGSPLIAWLGLSGNSIQSQKKGKGFQVSPSSSC